MIKFFKKDDSVVLQTSDLPADLEIPQNSEGIPRAMNEDEQKAFAEKQEKAKRLREEKKKEMLLQMEGRKKCFENDEIDKEIKKLEDIKKGNIEWFKKNGFNQNKAPRDVGETWMLKSKFEKSDAEKEKDLREYLKKREQEEEAAKIFRTIEMGKLN